MTRLPSGQKTTKTEIFVCIVINRRTSSKKPFRRPCSLRTPFAAHHQQPLHHENCLLEGHTTTITLQDTFVERPLTTSGRTFVYVQSSEGVLVPRRTTPCCSPLFRFAGGGKALLRLLRGAHVPTPHLHNHPHLCFLPLFRDDTASSPRLRS